MGASALIWKTLAIEDDEALREKSLWFGWTHPSLREAESFQKVFLALKDIPTMLLLYSREESRDPHHTPEPSLPWVSRSTPQGPSRFVSQQEASLPPRRYYWSRLELGVWLAQLPATPCQRLQVLAAALALSLEQKSVRKYYMGIQFGEGI